MSNDALANPNRERVVNNAHLLALDGLRGFAACAVVLHHFGGTLRMQYLVPRGYLAVDLFFVLSGYVLAFAYRSRLRGMGLRRFVVLRVIRLYPMIICGTIVGLFLAAFRFREHEPIIRDFVLVVIAGVLALPVLTRTTFPAETFPINGPVWSLTFELVASIAFAFIVERNALVRTSFLFAMVGGLSLILIAYYNNDLSVGPLTSNWAGGFARVAFSFFAGVLLQCEWIKPPRIPTLMATVFCLLPLLVPILHFGDEMIELTSVLLLFPLGIASLAQIDVIGIWTSICKISGEISFPLYAIHYPFVLAFASIWRVQHLGWLERLMLSVLLTALLTILALAVSRKLDIPLRAWLQANLLVPKGLGGAEESRSS